MKKIVILIFIIIIIVLITTAFAIYKGNSQKQIVTPVEIVYTPIEHDDEQQIDEEPEEIEEQIVEETKASNQLSDFDLSFLRLEDKKENLIYSPLSIKYALKMLEEAASGDSKAQITKLIGNYTPTKYVSNSNMSLANGLYVRDSFKENVKQEYIDLLKSKYDAEVKFDSFESAENINEWIKNKTLEIIPEMLQDSDVTPLKFALINALAIDMEWKELFLDETQYCERTILSFPNERLSYVYKPFAVEQMRFNGEENWEKSVSCMDVNAVINNYDIIKEIGEDNIRKTLEEEYWKQLEDPHQQELFKSTYPNDTQEEWIKNFIENYLKEIGENYHKYASSTEFQIYSDDDVVVFGKDLKKYGDNTLQYIGIMPKKVELDEYIKNVSSDSINKMISNLKEIKTENFKEGVATVIKGYIPKFKYEYDLKLKDDLAALGINDVFDMNLANLTNISKVEKGDEEYYNIFISDAKHKADIDFSQNGIKAAAVTVFGGGGGGGPEEFEFHYIYDVPTEEIEISFDKPYMYLIKDKDTDETWFVGTVYQPTLYKDEEQSFGVGV